MNILFDHQIFSLQRYGGISRYFFEIIRQISQHQNINIELALDYTDNSYILNNSNILPFSPAKNYNKFLKGRNFKGKSQLHFLLNNLGLIDHPILDNKFYAIKRLNNSRFDIFHPTYYDPYFLQYLRKKPFVLTIHDMIHELYFENIYKAHSTIIESKKTLAKQANKIIAVSENTKNDIIRLLEIDENKISVIYHGSSLTIDENYWEKLPDNYILFVGDRHTYKNFQFFLQSISPLLIKDKDLFLICAGSLPFNKTESELILKIGVEHRVVHKKIDSDIALANLYRNALCFVFPTLYEGFGIPVIEAFSCGSPVLLSNRSSLPEIGGEAAIYFDPNNTESIQESVKKVIYNKVLAENLRTQGYLQLKKFSWYECANQTINVYMDVLQN